VGDILCLPSDAVRCFRRTVRFPVAEQIKRERRATFDRQAWTNVTPEESAGSETVYEDYGLAAVPVAFDVDGAWADRNSQEI
jgi:hypothetical protein